MTAVELVRAELTKIGLAAEGQGMKIPPLRGKLLRPLTTISCVTPGLETSLNDQLWLGCLAIQMVHEASIIHDDVLDDGWTRRDRTTLVAEEGINDSLLAGDLYLTTAYRIAAMTNIDEFLNGFVLAVEAMVRGEMLQGSPSPVDPPQKNL